MSASAREAHMASCSPAAARKVSPAASRTRVPEVDSRLATLPTVVVLPTPLTPTNSHTSTGSAPASGVVGVRPSGASPGREPAPGRASEASAVDSIATRSSLRASTRASGPPISPPLTRDRRSFSRPSVAPTPTSARIRASSRSSQVAASIRPLERTAPR